MKLTHLLCLSMAVAAPAYGEASLDTIVSTNTLSEKIHEERRFVLFNSRQLSGECLDVCNPDPRSDDDVGGQTKEPTTSPTTKEPTDVPTKEPTGVPTKVPTNVPTKEPTNVPTNGPTNVPTKEPTNVPTNGPTNVPTKEPTLGQPTLDCDSLVNLGDGFSAAVGYGTGCFPHITNIDDKINGQAAFGADSSVTTFGVDNSVAVFAGGDYKGINGAEVEGKLVVLGDLIVESVGPSNFVSVGLGSQVIPSPNTDCIIVGGNLEAHRPIQVYNYYQSWMKCNIVFKGRVEDAIQRGNWKIGQGEVRADENYDVRHYENMLEVLKKKSLHWGELDSTATVSQPWRDHTKFSCTDQDEIQVFNIWPGEEDFVNGDSLSSYQFTDNCEGKTILINVHLEGNVGVNAVDLYLGAPTDRKFGYGENGFPTCMIQSILWNFPKATNIDIGNGHQSEFQGSILAVGNLKLSTSGHSGRTMVLGDIEQNYGGSEFHNYQFNPPIALPDPDNICDIDSDYVSEQNDVPVETLAKKEDQYSQSQVNDSVDVPTKEPTEVPTNGPTNVPTNKPTNVPTNKPTNGSETSPAKACFRNDYKTRKTNQQCHKNKNQCKNCGGGYWLDDVPRNNCIAHWGTCTNDVKGCCPGLQCVGNKWYRQCKEP